MHVRIVFSVSARFKVHWGNDISRLLGISTLFATPFASRPHLIVIAFLDVTLVHIEELLIEGPLKADTVDAARRAQTHDATADPFTILKFFEGYEDR